MAQRSTRSTRRTLLIPAEEQTREFDAKLLLACVAAERGLPVILGNRREIHLKAASLPKGIYLAKSFRPISLRMFEILRGLGYEIVAFDEEGLLPYPDAIYFERRLSAETLALVSHLLAWGPENAALLKRFPAYDGTELHITGNPRVDLMRPDLRACFDADVERLRTRYGDFILVNTNFASVNHRVSSLDLANQVASETTTVARYLAGIERHKAALYSHFIRMVAELTRAFPHLTVVVRPHPLENHEPWREAVAGCANAHVLHEGNVVPWLIAAKALVQNSCTTAIEAYILGTPVVEYRPVVDEEFDEQLCVALAHHAHDTEQLCETLREIVAGRLGRRDGPDQRNSIESRIAGLDGRLASDRIVDAIERIEAAGPPPSPGSMDYAHAWLTSHYRSLQKGVRSLIPGDKNNREYQLRRFPNLGVADVVGRINDFARQLGRFEKLRVEPITAQIFRIESEGA